MANLLFISKTIAALEKSRSKVPDFNEVRSAFNGALDRLRVLESRLWEKAESEVASDSKVWNALCKAILLKSSSLGKRSYDSMRHTTFSELGIDDSLDLVELVMEMETVLNMEIPDELIEGMNNNHTPMFLYSIIQELNDARTGKSGK